MLTQAPNHARMAFGIQAEGWPAPLPIFHAPPLTFFQE